MMLHIGFRGKQRGAGVTLIQLCVTGSSGSLALCITVTGYRRLVPSETYAVVRSTGFDVNVEVLGNSTVCHEL